MVDIAVKLTGAEDYYSSAGHVLSGFPAQYTGQRVWTGADMIKKESEWISVLSDQDLAHIAKALRYFQGLNLGPECLATDTFPLPHTLANRLKEVSRDVYNGRGFVVLRGLRPELFTTEENVLIFGGISAYVGSIRGFQDVGREFVNCHVISEELKLGAEKQDLRPAFTNGRLSFHTDLGDILTLFTLDVSNNGGNTMLASSSNIYNELNRTRHDLLQELNEKWVFFRTQDYETNGTPLVINAPSDKLIFQYSRLPNTGFRNKGKNETLPQISEKRIEAMHAIEDLAWKHCFPLPHQKGDIAFINNMCLMHGRQAFDHDDHGNALPSRRHLVKLMLRDPELTWKVPDSLNWLSERVYGPNQDDGGRIEKWRLGIHSEDLPKKRVWAGSGTLANG